MTTDDIELVRDYAAHQSEQAFETLVSRHANLVYSTALRQVGDPHLAEEITQAVFIILARKAAALNAGTILPAWLYRTACYAATDALKIQRRRQRHELEAHMQSELQPTVPAPLWELIAPHLDEALMRLGEKDRQAVVLHFFEKRTFVEVGNLMGTSEEGARKRTHRALEKLRQFLSRRGLVSSAMMIAGAVAANSVQAAPAALAKTLTAVAIAKETAASGSTATLIKGTLKIMAWTKAKIAIVVGAGVLLTSAPAVILVERHMEAKQYAIAPSPWSDVGAATPKAALQTLAWAIAHNKPDRADELMRWNEKGVEFIKNPKLQRQRVLMAVLAPEIGNIKAFRIQSIEPTKQPNEVRVRLEKTFKNENIEFAVTTLLRRVGNEWRAVGDVEYYENGNSSVRLPFTGAF